jgi:mRNA interferase MazF
MLDSAVFVPTILEKRKVVDEGYPFEVLIPDGLKISGAILSDRLKNLDWKARQAELVCKLPSATIDEVLQKLNTLLGQ